MEKLVGFCVVAAIVLLYFIVKYFRGEIPYSLGNLLKILFATIIVTTGWLVIPVFSILVIGWAGVPIAILSAIISSWIGYKLLKND